jgi:hypothetical protein
MGSEAQSASEPITQIERQNQFLQNGVAVIRRQDVSSMQETLRGIDKEYL